jgi:predicted MFS family arabinose efflux permease
MNIGYNGLFWADGATCIMAISIFWLLVKEKKQSPFSDQEHPGEILTHSVFRDREYWIFLATSFTTAMIFFQLFTTIPLYHHDRYGITEFQTGLMMTLNGLLVFALEMPIVGYFERKKTLKITIIAGGAVCMAASFWVMLADIGVGILLLNVVLISFGEMFAFPFSNSFAMGRAPKGHEGRYMALYTMTFGLAHIASAKVGMETIAHFGYKANWTLMGALGIISAAVALYLRKRLHGREPKLKI